jgi:hypothetical protein
MREANAIMPRGVYSLPFFDEKGREQLVAIDRRGRALGGSTVVFPWDDRTAVLRMLERVLDRLDPEEVRDA